MPFSQLQLIEPIQRALIAEGYVKPTPIQEKSIPIILQQRDLIGCAQTGTGKTAAFAIPILQLLFQKHEITKAPRQIRALILTPTRELAVQIGDSFATYGKHTHLKYTVVYGGVSQHPQTQALHKGVDILVATPGRLLDLMNQGHVHLKNLEIFVLDEADRMLDMGFIIDVKRILTSVPSKRQSLLFCATMPIEIVKLASSLLSNPIKVEIAPVLATTEAIQQSLYFVDRANKKDLLLHIFKEQDIHSALIFTRTKRGADILTKFLNKEGINAEAIHGNKSQGARQRALNNFKRKVIKVLVASDIAARGIDIDELSHVINFEMPDQPETYVHRIGRTGRAGATGIALSFCDRQEKSYLRSIHKLIDKTIPIVTDHPFPLTGRGSSEPAPRSHSSSHAQPTRERDYSNKQKSSERRNERGSDRKWHKKEKHGERNERDNARPWDKKARYSEHARPTHERNYSNKPRTSERRSEGDSARPWHTKEKTTEQAQPGADRRSHSVRPKYPERRSEGGYPGKKKRNWYKQQSTSRSSRFKK